MNSPALTAIQWAAPGNDLFRHWMNRWRHLNPMVLFADIQHNTSILFHEPNDLQKHSTDGIPPPVFLPKEYLWNYCQQHAKHKCNIVEKSMLAYSGTSSWSISPHKIISCCLTNECMIILIGKPMQWPRKKRLYLHKSRNQRDWG